MRDRHLTYKNQNGIIGINKEPNRGETKAKAALAERMRALGYSEEMIRELMGV